MRVVLDSSVLIAACVSRAGVCSELLEEVLERHDLVLSNCILDEVRRQLTRKFFMPASLIDRVVGSLHRAAIVVEPATLPTDACRDPSDIPVLDTALGGQAALLVTVDRGLLSLTTYRDILIIKPGAFWRQAGLSSADRIQDADIDTTDIPPLGDQFFRRAKLRLPEPKAKASITIRVDRDVIDWFKAQGAGYQTRINAILRMYMEAQRR